MVLLLINTKTVNNFVNTKVWIINGENQSIAEITECYLHNIGIRCDRWHCSQKTLCLEWVENGKTTAMLILQSKHKDTFPSHSVHEVIDHIYNYVTIAQSSLTQSMYIPVYWLLAQTNMTVIKA